MSTPTYISNLVIESDCLLVLEEINQHERPASVVGNLLVETRELMTGFPGCRIQHRNRMGNRVAHSLARNAWQIN